MVFTTGGRRTGLTAARGQKGWSMRALADAVGTDKGYISRLESGKATPSFEMAHRICTTLRCGFEVWELPSTSCPSCGSITLPDALVCIECGQKLHLDGEEC